MNLELAFDLQVLRIRQQLSGYFVPRPNEQPKRCVECDRNRALPDRHTCSPCTERKKRGLSGDWHGTASGYTHRRCRCERCRAWRRDSARMWRATRSGLKPPGKTLRFFREVANGR